ncbi:hypothetical protein EYS14_11335 [Alteromonadaceae bacterium M269]|nr:hypothetical protein EYS14_11335 [Alteromonadaceae bacterium M269]
MNTKLHHIIAYGWLFTLILLKSFDSDASPDLFGNSQNCQILFSLDNGSQIVFEQQAQVLAPYISRLNIELFDLNKPHSEQPFQTISGRKRRQMKQWLGWVNGESRAIVRYEQAIVFESSGNLDLTLLLETCQRHAE